MDRRGVHRDLVGSGSEQPVDVLDRGHSPADRQRDEDLLGRPGHDLHRGGPALVGRGDVEEGQLVGALRVVPSGELDRVAGVAEVLEVHALDHPAGVDVEARDDAYGETHAAVPVGRDHVQRVGEREPALVERGPDDRALDPGGHQAGESLEVGELGDAAARDDRPVGGGADVAEELEVRPLEHAVLVHVGDHVAGAALGVEPGQHLVEVAALASPSARREGAAAHVETDCHAVAPRGDGGGAPLRLLEGGGADVHPAAAGGHGGGERVVVPDAAAQLDPDVDPADDGGQELAVVAASERRVEVDQVDPLGAGLLPAQRRLDRVAEALLGPRHALDELHRLAARDVDGRQQLEVRGHGV